MHAVTTQKSTDLTTGIEGGVFGWVTVWSGAPARFLHCPGSVLSQIACEPGKPQARSVERHRAGTTARDTPSRVPEFAALGSIAIPSPLRRFPQLAVRFQDKAPGCHYIGPEKGEYADRSYIMHLREWTSRRCTLSCWCGYRREKNLFLEGPQSKQGKNA